MFDIVNRFFKNSKYSLKILESFEYILEICMCDGRDLFDIEFLCLTSQKPNVCQVHRHGTHDRHMDMMVDMIC